ncbi:MAG: transposase [Prevotella sp.]|nr:transposase [Prevotella sp.]
MKNDPSRPRPVPPPFAKACHPSMLRRCPSHDYSSRQIYLVTLTTERRHPLFGHLEGDVDLPFLDPRSPHIVLSLLGEAVEQVFRGIPSYYPQVSVIQLQMMPDHLHVILFVKEQMDKTLGDVIRGAKIACNKEYRRLGFAPLPLSSAPRADQWDPEHPNRSHSDLFAPGYNDRLLHDGGQLQTWVNYLTDNPRRALVKHQHPDYFRVRQHVEYAGYEFSAIGNLFLLDRPVKLQVQCSRSMTAGEIDQKAREMAALPTEGTVLVSPSISPGEKAVMRAAFQAGLAEIILEENGFADMEKPVGGARFDACSRGQMLFLSPWRHHNDHRTIERMQCLQLNGLAAAICAFHRSPRA